MINVGLLYTSWYVPEIRRRRNGQIIQIGDNLERVQEFCSLGSKITIYSRIKEKYSTDLQAKTAFYSENNVSTSTLK